MCNTQDHGQLLVSWIRPIKYRVFKKNGAVFILQISRQPTIGFLICFFPLKTEIHTWVLNTKQLLYDFRGLRNLQNKIGFLIKWLWSNLKLFDFDVLNTGCPAKHVPLLFFEFPFGLEIPSWTFFNNPFRVDIKNSHFFYYLVKPGTRYCQDTKGRPFQKSNFFCLLLNQELE